MKTSEAKSIVKTILEWQFVLQGIVKRDEVQVDKKLEEYSLSELIQANRLVKANNNRKTKLQEYYRKKNGKANGISHQMTLADRVIAGVYFALHYPTNGEASILINDIVAGCVPAKYK